MASLFATLFSRGKYSSSLDSERHAELERFAVAALAFCLEHDERFREGFFRELGIVGKDSRSSVWILPESRPWADLMIATKDVVHVFEAKAGARVGNRQNPAHEDFWDPNVGYGFRLKEYASHRVRKYWKVGWNDGIDQSSTIRGIEVEGVSWEKIAGLAGGTIVSDFKSFLASKALISSSVMSKTNIDPIHRARCAMSAAETTQVLVNVFTHFQIPFSGVEGHAAADGWWWFQSKIVPSPHKESQKNMQLLSFEDLLGDSFDGCLGWVGYEFNVGDVEPHRCVRLHCANDHLRDLELRLMKFNPDPVPENGYMGVVVRSFSEDSDELWFIEVLEAAGLKNASS